jgi:predicted lipoprotein with Yx(FWY)xxD motif
MAVSSVRCAAGILAGLFTGLSTALAASTAPSTTPTGVTLVEVVRELSSSQPELLWMRPGDAEGRTLFSYVLDTPTASNCIAECAKEWVPLKALPGSKAYGDWSLVKRTDGTLQWSYNERPLYSWAKEEVPGDVATTVAVKEVSNSKLAENARKLGALTPPEGWNVVRFAPAVTSSVPDGIDVRVVATAHGVALTDHNGLTLYAFDGDAKKDNQVCAATGCNIKWIPAPVPELAGGVGDFTVVMRLDGTRQWAYKKKPLYRYSGDKLPDDVRGAHLDKRWSVVLMTENFYPSQVGIAFREGYGDTLAVNGMTLYTGIAYEKRWGGRNLRDNYRNAYYRGKKLAGETCTTEQCLKVWKPFLANLNDKPNGFWEVIARTDGAKQWAYKGYALYTHTGDKIPSEMNGNDTYDYVDYNDTSEDAFKRASLLVDVNGVSAVYWHIAKP